MSRPGPRIFGSLVLSHTGVFLFSLAQAFWMLPKGILDEFSWKWIWNRTFAGTIELVPLACAMALLFAWSFFIDKNVVRQFLGKKPQFWRLINSSLVMALVYGSLYLIVLLFAAGSFYGGMASAEADSRLSSVYFENSLAAHKEGDYPRAYEEVRKSLAIAPENKAAILHKDLVLSLIAREGLRESNDEDEDKGLEGWSWDDHMKRANAYKAAGDLYSALYYAEASLLVADRKENSQREVSDLLIRELREAIGATRLSPEDLARNRIHQLKKIAILSQYANKEYVKSYFTLKELERAAPLDQDLKLWMPKVVNALKDVAFFEDEMEKAQGRGSGNSLFVRFPREGGGNRFLYADQVLRGQFSEFLEGMEYLETDAGGTTILHMKAPAGKIVPLLDQDGAKVSGTWLIQTQAIRRIADKEGEGIKTRAALDVGTRAPGEENIYTIPVSGADLFRLASSGADYRTSSVQDLLAYLDLLPRLSWDLRPVQMELLRRLSKGASVFVFWFLAMGIGWSNRSRYLKKPPLIAILTMFILPMASYLAIRFYDWTNQQILAGILVLGGFDLALILTLVAVAIQLVGSLILAAVQKLD